MLPVAFGMLTQARHAHLTRFDAAHLTVGEAQATGDFDVGFLADEIQPNSLGNLRPRRDFTCLRPCPSRNKPCSTLKLSGFASILEPSRA